MKKKKAVKRLMAMGVQRNDAAAFVATYRAIEAAGKAHLLPVALQPVPEFAPRMVIVKPQTFAMKYTVTNTQRQQISEEEEKWHKNKMARDLGSELLRKGYIKIVSSPSPHYAVKPPDIWDHQPAIECIEATEYFASIRVLPPMEETT